MEADMVNTPQGLTLAFWTVPGLALALCNLSSFACPLPCSAPETLASSLFLRPTFGPDPAYACRATLPTHPHLTVPPCYLHYLFAYLLTVPTRTPEPGPDGPLFASVFLACRTASGTSELLTHCSFDWWPLSLALGYLLTERTGFCSRIKHTSKPLAKRTLS